MEEQNYREQNQGNDQRNDQEYSQGNGQRYPGGNEYGYYGQNMQRPPQNDALAIVGLVMGILSIPAGCCYGIGIIFAITGLICSIIAIRKMRSGMAIAGILTSAIGFVIAVLVIAAFVAFVRSGMYQEIYNEIYRNLYQLP